MARDYSSRRNNPPDRSGQRKTPKRTTPAAKPVRAKKTAAPKSNRSGSAQPSAKNTTPGWVWFACGLLVAIVVGSIYYIASRPAGHGPQSVEIDLPTADNTNPTTSTDQNESAEPATETNSTAQSESEPRFSFYKMLPNYEVEVPTDERARPPAHAPHESEPSAPAHTTPAPTSEAASSPNDDNGQRYIIQAGAFSTRQDADQRKAQLALLGVTADIVDIQSSGRTVYRVQSQAMATHDDARTMAQRLQSHGIETMIRHAR